MTPSITRLYNAVSWQGWALTGPAFQIDGLRSPLNRTFWLAERWQVGIDTDGSTFWVYYSDKLAAQILAANRAQGLRLVVCLPQFTSIEHSTRVLNLLSPQEIVMYGNEFDDADAALSAVEVAAWMDDSVRNHKALRPDIEYWIGSIQSIGGHGQRTTMAFGDAYNKIAIEPPPAFCVHAYSESQPVGQWAKCLNWQRGVLRALGWEHTTLEITEAGVPWISKMYSWTATSVLRSAFAQAEDAGVRNMLFWAGDDYGSKWSLGNSPELIRSNWNGSAMGHAKAMGLGAP